MSLNLPPINKIAQIMGGDLVGAEELAPGPGHSAEDRSLAIKLDNAAPDGFVVHSFAGDDPITCRDQVREKLGLPEFEPKKKASGSSGKNKKGNGGAKPWSPIIARYVYRKAVEARAQFDAPENEVHVRVAGRDNCIYIDLADRAWRAIEIDEDGWRVVDNPPVYFRRSSGMKPLPEPVAGGSLNDDLQLLLNVKSDNEFVLNVAWLLAALRPSGPYPVLALTGEQGSAKTMRANLLRALVDPNSVPLRALPRSEHDVFIAARNGHLLAYDNASGLPDWLSDTFCRLATGGGFSMRELYTDQDEVLFGSKRPIILNGIDDIATRPDLADRSIVQTLAAISEERRKLETELWADFERKRPRLLGALLTAVSHGLRTLPDVKLDRKPRMADCAVWVTACEGALWKKGTFMAAYTGNIQEAVETVLENDEVAAVLRTYMYKTPRFEGTASSLLEALNSIATEAQRKTKGWPKKPAVLGKILRRIAPPLRKIGIDVALDRESRQRGVTITPVKAGQKPSQLSQPSLFNSDTDLEKAARGHHVVTDQEASVTCDGKDSDSDSNDLAATPNRLKNKDGDGSDGSDGIFPNSSSRVPSELDRNALETLARGFANRAWDPDGRTIGEFDRLETELRQTLGTIVTPERVESEFERVMVLVYGMQG